MWSEMWAAGWRFCGDSHGGRMVSVEQRGSDGEKLAGKEARERLVSKVD